MRKAITLGGGLTYRVQAHDVGYGEILYDYDYHPTAFSDYSQLEMFYMALHGRASNVRDLAESISTRKELFSLGDAGLAICDRSPMILRFYTLRLLEADNGDVASQDLRKALDFAERLTRYEPNSAEVHVLYTRALQTAGEYDHALREAEISLDLDPTIPEGWRLKGALTFLLVSRGDPTKFNQRMLENAPKIVQFYRKMLSLPDGQLNVSDVPAYVIALIFVGDYDDAVAQGRKLQGQASDDPRTPLNILCASINALEVLKSKPGLAADLIRRIKEPAASPAPVPASAAPSSPAPAPAFPMTMPLQP